MEKLEYRPRHIEFDVASDGSNMPESFGRFEDEKEVAEFFGNGLITLNHAITVSRHMDMHEKVEIRKEYNNVLEDVLPLNEKSLSEAAHELEKAKKTLKNAQEMVNAALTKVKTLAVEVKHGVKDIKLEDIYTHRIAYRGRYYFYTWIDKELRLCNARDIPESEKEEIWNQLAPNEIFIDEKFGNESPETQEGS